MAGNNTIFVKNSSTEINFGTYDLDLRFATDGGRIFTSKKYYASIEVEDTNGKRNLKVTIHETEKNPWSKDT